MPSLADLLDPNKYGLEPEVAFLLYRPVLSRVPFPAPPSAKDEEDGEIPEGDQVPMEVEQGETRSDHARYCMWCKLVGLMHLLVFVVGVILCGKC